MSTAFARAEAFVVGCVDEGRGAVVAADGPVAEQLRARFGGPDAVDWLTLPPEDGLVVLGDAPGHLEHGAWLGALAAMRLHPCRVVLTGTSRDAVPSGVALDVSERGEAAEGARLRGLTLEEGEARVVAMLDHADRGDLLEASVRWRSLARAGSTVAADHAWIELQRLVRSGRRDEVLSRAMELPVSAAGRGRTLLMVATAHYLRGAVGPWLGQLDHLVAQTDDPALAQDAEAFIAYVRHAVRADSTAFRAATSWQTALAEASLLEEGRAPGPMLTGMPGRLGDALRAYFGLGAPGVSGDRDAQRALGVRLAVAAGHPCDALTLRPRGYGDGAEAYRESVSAAAMERCAHALDRGDVATAREARATVPNEARAGRDVWADALATYDVVLAAVSGDRADVVSTLSDATRRFPTAKRRNPVKRLWRRLEACGGAADPWIRARVAGWVLDRLEDDDAFELSSRALPTLPPVPVALGPYALDEVLGEGGMGMVWRGRHTPTDRPVAVKVLRSGRPHDDAHAFAAEVALTSRLEHPAVVGVLDHGMVADSASLQSRGALTPGQPYLVLEYVPGGTLSDYVGRLSYPEVRAVAVALLDALGYAHARGVLHRDLKPENVLVTHDGAVRLTDFGLAVYRTDRAAGTPYYMSPEQYRGAPLDGRTDLYGLGCLLWHLVTGHPLFRGTLREVRDGHLGGERPPLVATCPVPAGFEAWLLRLVAPSPTFRFAHAAHAARALPAASSDEEPTAPVATTLGDAFAPAVTPPPGAPTISATFVMDAILDGAPPAPVVDEVRGWLPEVPTFTALQWRGRPQLPSPRMADRGDPPLVAHRDAARLLWTELRAVQQRGAPRRVGLDAPWGSVALLVDELVLTARRHGVHVEDRPQPGRLAVVAEATPSPVDPWLVVASDGADRCIDVPVARSREQLLAAIGRFLARKVA